MSDAITPEIFQHLVQLAALDLNEQESDYLRAQLNNQLKAIRELEAIPLEVAVQPTSHGVAYTANSRPAIRADEHAVTVKPENVLAQAPQTEENYIVVPDIPHIDLD